MQFVDPSDTFIILGLFNEYKLNPEPSIVIITPP